MQKARKSYHWIKWHTKETLYGSFTEESPESLGFFVKLCCYSAESRYPGYIQSEYQKGIGHFKLAAIFNIPEELFGTLLENQVKMERVTVNGTGVIDILKWEKYQSIPKWDGKPDTEPPLEIQPTPEQLPSRRKGNRPQDNKDPEKYQKGKLGHMIQS